MGQDLIDERYIQDGCNRYPEGCEECVEKRKECIYGVLKNPIRDYRKKEKKDLKGGQK